MSRRKTKPGTPVGMLLAGGIQGWRPGLACITDGHKRSASALVDDGRCIVCGARLEVAQ